MFKIYKKVIVMDSNDAQNRLGAPENIIIQEQKVSRIANWLAIPAMIIGGIISVLFLSVFFVLLLIPVGILGYKFWRRLKKMQQDNQPQDIIDAEYTVIDEQSNKK